jgi:predicted metalloprotease
MRWQGRRESDNVEARRGMGGGIGGGFGGYPGGGFRVPVGRGGLGIGGVVVLLVVGWLLGINPMDLLSGDTSGGSLPVDSSANQQAGRIGAPADEEGRFVSTVLADTEDAWHKIFAGMGRTYRDPTLVLFTG